MACCGVCDGDEQLVLQQQKRAESLEELRRMKGVTTTSMTQLAVEQLAVVEAAYSKLGSRNRCLCCYPLQALTRWPLFLALCLFTAALFALNSYPVELNQVSSSRNKTYKQNKQTSKQTPKHIQKIKQVHKQYTQAHR